MTSEHPNAAMLRAVYADLSSIGQYLTHDVVLHTAEREVPGAVRQVIGQGPVVTHEQALIAATGATLVMRVEQIIANDYFGAVTGSLCAERDGAKIALPFCGLWRFDNGRIAEHWENAYDVAEFGRFLSGEVAGANFVAC